MLQYMSNIIDSWTAKADSPAVIDSTTYLTGRQCAAVADATIRLLREQGLQAGDVVSVTGSDTLAKIPMMFGMHLSEFISSTLAPFASASVRSRMLNESGARILIVDRRTRHMAEEVMTSDYSCTIIEEEDFLEPGAELDPRELLRYTEQAQPSDWNILRYTSGSTGTPKGTIVDQMWAELVTSSFLGGAGGLPGKGNFLCTTPLSSVEGSVIAQIFASDGLTPCIYRGRATPAGILAEMERLSISAVFLPSSQAVAIVRDPSFELTDLTALHTVVYAGQAISPTDQEEVIKAFGGEKLVQLYGQGEVGFVSALTREDHCSGDPDILASAGRVLFPDDVQIRDDNGNEVPEGVSGELFVKGHYAHSAQWTPERTWVPAVQPDGWMTTTDLARRAGDRIWITGRKRDMVLYRGYNVPTRPIEEALQRFNGILDAVVHPVADSYAGEVVFAWIKLEEGASVDKEAACDHVQKEVSKWSRPSYIEVMEEVPSVSVLRKFDKVALRTQAEALLDKAATHRLKGPDGVR